jgi:hypothetical protein
MRKKSISQAGLFHLRTLVAFALCSCGVLLAMLSVAATTPAHTRRANINAKSPLNAAAETPWDIINSPNTSSTESNRLWSTACVSSSECWAVGDHYPGNSVTSAQTLIERWDGNSWAIVSSPNVGTYDTLTSVTCVSASDCWTVGNYLTAAPAYLTLIEHWDGSSWSIIPSPNAIGSSNNFLFGVTCVSSAECWAVGYATNGNTLGSGYDTLIERWNGTAWSVVSSPNVGTGQSSRLLSVTCASSTECWAAGYSYIGSDADARTLIERWDGTAWTIVESPNALTAQNFLVGVTCVSASNCWAAGYTNDAGVTSAHQTLIEHWDGNSWVIVSSPNTSSTQHNWLTGITCASASECWAVGYYIGSTYLNLIEHWDGSAWTVVTPPNNGSSLNLLYGVTCASTAECWAVGVFSTGSAWQTLTERHLVPPVPLAGVASRKVHGSGGTFDVDLPLDGSGIECRSGDVNNDYTLVFTFAEPLTSVGGVSVTSGTGSVSGGTIGTDAHQYIVELTGVANAQRLGITLSNVYDVAGDISSSVSVTMEVLIGDTTADGFVNSGDIAQTKSQSGQVVTAANFREDLTADGSINSGDISLVKSKSGTALP